jgi:hypothetical protein
MDIDARTGSSSIVWLAPGSALLFSLIVAMLAPHYARWFGSAMPAFTRGFIAWYPFWIAFSVVAVLTQVCVRILRPRADDDGSASTLDLFFGIVSALVIAAGILALAIPVVLAPNAVG